MEREREQNGIRNGDNKSSGRCPELFIMGYKRMKFKNKYADGNRELILFTSFSEKSAIE